MLMLYTRLIPLICCHTQSGLLIVFLSDTSMFLLNLPGVTVPVKSLDTCVQTFDQYCTYRHNQHFLGLFHWFHCAWHNQTSMEVFEFCQINSQYYQNTIWPKIAFLTVYLNKAKELITRLLVKSDCSSCYVYCICDHVYRFGDFSPRQRKHNE